MPDTLPPDPFDDDDDERAYARSGDPWTSWAAAHGVNVKPSQQAVLWAFHEYGDGGLILEEVVAIISRTGRRFADSRIRTAVNELTKPTHNGRHRRPALLFVTGETRRTKRGKQARVVTLNAPAPDPNTPALF